MDGVRIREQTEVTLMAPFHHVEELFPLVKEHCHSPSIAELPNGDLLACWFQGSGERTADDVRILGARRPSQGTGWTEPFLMANTRGFPDCNPLLFVDPRGVLWLVWPAIVANRWETALLRCRRSNDYQHSDGPPNWDWQDVILLKPGEAFVAAVDREVAFQLEALPDDDEARAWAEHLRERARDKYFRRMGWMPRNQPLFLEEDRLLLPLYSDGFSFSLIAHTDDWGETWTTSEPLVGAGSIQPSVVQKTDGTLVAYMRDNGPPPKRLHRAESADGGVSWGHVASTELPNPGSSALVLALPSGDWLLVGNDLERGRHRLAAFISGDEGASWTLARYFERAEREPVEEATRAHYPTVIRGRDGVLHAVYSYHHNDRSGPHKTIRYVSFDEAWLRGE